MFKNRRIWQLVIALVVMTVVLSLASGVWASPNQRNLRQTVPTRTPVPEEPTATPVPPTNTPVPPTNTPVPPTATPKPKKKEKKQEEPTPVPTEVVEPTVEAEAVVISYPETGADMATIFRVSSAVVAVAGCGLYAIRRRREDR